MNDGTQKEPTNALETLQAFFHAQLVEQNPEKAGALLSSRAVCMGTTADVLTVTLEETVQHLNARRSPDNEPYEISFSHCCDLPIHEKAGSAMLYLTISKKAVTAQCRASCSALVEDGSWKLLMVHLSVPNIIRKATETLPFSLSSDSSRQLQEQLLSSAAAGGILGYCPEGEFPIFFINATMLQSLGYHSQEEFFEATDGLAQNFIHPDDRESRSASIRQQLLISEDYGVSYRACHRDGSVLWFYENGKKYLDESGRTSVGALCLDTTRQKEAELELLEKETLYRLTIDNSSSSMWKYDMHTDTVYQTEQSMAMHPGFELVIPNYINHLLTTGYIRPDSIADFIEMHRRVNEGETEVTGDIWFSDNKGGWWCEHIIYTILPDFRGVPLYAVGVGRNITAEMQLQADKAHMDLALNSTTLALWTYDLATDVISSQSKGSERAGFEGRIIPGGYQRIINDGLVMPESVEDYIELHKGLLRGEKSTAALIHFDPKKLNLEWQRITYSNVFDRDGKPIMGVAVGEDVTSEIIAEQRYAQELRNQEALQGKNLFGKLRANLSKNYVELYFADEPVMRITPKITKISTVVRYICENCVVSRDTARMEALLNADFLLEQFSIGETDFELEYQRQMLNGSTRWMGAHAHTYIAPESGDVMLFLYAYDIDKEKTMQTIVERLIAVEYEMTALIFTKSGTIRFIRSSALEQELVPQIDDEYEKGLDIFLSFLSPEEDRESITAAMRIPNVCRSLDETGTCSFTFLLNVADGPCRKKCEFLYLDDRHNTIMCVRSDVTELFRVQEDQQRKLKNALQQAEQANIAKTEFLSRMSHEIRTPMNAIIGMSALAAQCVNDPAQVADCIAKVGISARYLLSLINDILDMSRIESGKMILTQGRFLFEELIAGINTIAYELAATKQLDYECIVTSFTDNAYVGDAMKLQQVLINLISNAIKFTPAGGKVQFIISAQRTENGKAPLNFRVKDTGIGIRPDFISKLFEPFEQAHMGATNPYGGTGLGLAISKSLIEMMEGEITVNSIQGIGTEFLVKIPLGQCETVVPRLKIQQPPNWSELTALIVDDESAICTHTQRVLHEIGIRAEWINSSTWAVKLVQEKQHSGQKFDFILLDWKMPEVDGIETARILRKIVGPDVTIIIMTAYDWMGIEAEAKSAGVNLLITKPLFRSTIYSAFERLYQKNQLTSSEQRPQVYDFTGKRVLLVEDHTLNVEVAKRLLAAKGMAVEVASNGLQALESFTLSTEGYYDAILMDIRMPVMDGLTAARSIRQLRKSDARRVPIIAMSANAFEEDIEKSKLAGIDAYLSKPIEPTLLFETLYSYLFEQRKDTPVGEVTPQGERSEDI